MLMLALMQGVTNNDGGLQLTHTQAPFFGY